MRYFWKNKFVPKELQEHINKTLRQVRSNKIPIVNPAAEVKEFVEKASLILSGTNEKREQKE